MSQFGQNYETTRIMSESDMWALHALQWKAYLHIATTGGTWDDSLLDINDLEQQNYPFSQPLCNVPPDFLDSKEDISSGVYQDAQGNPVDPAGSWTCRDDNYPLDSVQSAVIAAMNMHYWGTPTYTDAFSFGLFPYDTWKVAIEQVTLCALGNQAPHEVCGWGNDWNDSYGSIGSCTSILAFDSIKVGIFTLDSQAYFVPHQTLSSATWAAMYGAYGYDTLWNHLVFDPPKETSKEDISRLEEMAGRTAENMLIVQVDPTIKDDVWIGRASDLSEEVIGKRPSHAAHAAKKDFIIIDEDVMIGRDEADHSEKVIGERPLH